MPPPVKYPLLWIRLVRYAGTAEKLAEAWGVHYTTLRRWALGEVVPDARTRFFVGAWCKERRLPYPWPNEK